MSLCSVTPTLPRQWKDAAADPTSTTPSQQWYEAEVAYLQNKCSELEVKVAFFTDHNQDDVERAMRAERRVRELEAEVERLHSSVEALTSTDSKTFADAQTMTEKSHEERNRVCGYLWQHAQACCNRKFTCAENDR